jgi:hypothetical protein
MVQDLLTPASQGLTEGANLGDVVGATTDDGLVEGHGSFPRVVGQIDVTDRFFGYGLRGDWNAQHPVGLAPSLRTSHQLNSLIESGR